MHLDETVDYWLKREHGDLAHRVAVLHKARRQQDGDSLKNRVSAVRKSVSDLFIKGRGVEVGAGPRPFPIPEHASCVYGDIRDGEELTKYFANDGSPPPAMIDAQTFSGIADNQFDFAISAHVIEHLQDPLGSIANTMRVLKPSGIFVLIVPDMRYTFDRNRTPTPIEHLLQDWRDGGASTKIDAYIEFIRDVAIPVWGHKFSTNALEDEARRLASVDHDIHFHAWTSDTFGQMLERTMDLIGFTVLGRTSVVNEAIFVLKKGN